MNEENEPVFELNKENVIRMVNMLSKGDINTIVPASSMTLVFMKKPEEIESVMEELAKEGKISKKRFMGLNGYSIK